MNTDGQKTIHSQDSAYQAGDLRIDIGQQRVQRGDTIMPLPKLSFDLLVALIRAEPNFVSNEDLMTIVWPGVIVSPETVTQRLKLLRDSLGDDPRQPQYIEGLRGRGYRFMQRVELLAHQRETESATPAAAASNAATAKTPTVSVALILVTVIALAAYLLLKQPRSVPALAATTNTEFDRSVAVLPFEQLGGNSSDNFIGPSISEAVQSRLATIHGLTVLARDTTFRFASPSVKLDELGRRLGARYFVTGSAQTLAQQLRVNIRLIDSVTQSQLWSQQDTQPMPRLFALQDAISAGIAAELEKRVANIVATASPPEHSPNPEAYLAYLRGRSLLGRFTISDAEAAAAELTRSVALDPAFGAAYVTLYDARMQSATLRREEKAVARRRYRPLIDQATRLSANSAALLYARAMWDDDEVAQSLRHFERAAELDPNNGRGLTAYAQALNREHRAVDSQRILQRALRVDPQSPRANFQAAMLTFGTLGAGVEREMLKVLELDPKFYPALMRYSKYQWQLHGESAQAIALIERAIADDPENPWGRHLAAAYYLDAGDLEAAESVVAGYAVCEQSTRALFALYRHDWRAAGIAALDPRSYEFSPPERWGVTTALRDYALRSGDLQRVQSELATRYALPPRGAWTLGTDNFREAALLAHLQLVNGNRDGATERLNAVITWIDANEKFGPVFNLQTKARALMLLGLRDAALVTLAQSFRQNDYTMWWYTLEQDPTWDPVRHDPRFREIDHNVHLWVEGQKKALARLRAQGTVPIRRRLP